MLIGDLGLSGSARTGCGFLLRFMMRKSHRPDKRRKQGRLQERNRPRMPALIPSSGVSIWPDFAARYGMPAVKTGSQNNKRKRMSKDGLCAIVTGSASGLEAATAAILAEGGGKIVVNYSNSKK